VAEDESARTERELIALRAGISADIDLLVAKVRQDSDPRTLLTRRPLAAAGAAVAALAAVASTLGRRGKPRRKKGEPMRDRATEAGFVAGSQALSTFAAEAAKRLATRLLDDGRR